MIEGEYEGIGVKTGLSRLWLGIGLGVLILFVALTSLVALNFTDDDSDGASSFSGDGSGTLSVDSDLIVSPQSLAYPTVRVVGLDNDGSVLCGGSGTIVTPTGQVLTSAKVVTPTTQCDFGKIGVSVVKASDSKPSLEGDALAEPVLAYEAELLSTDSALDIAIIRIVRNISDGSSLVGQFSAPTLGNSDDVDKEDEVQLSGFPSAEGSVLEVVDTKVVGFTQRSGVPEGRLIQTDSPTIVGFAGGTAADSSGRVLGIVGSSSFEEGLGCLDLSDPAGTVQSQADCESSESVNVIRPINLAIPLVEEAEGALPIKLRTFPATDVSQQIEFSRPRFTLGASETPDSGIVKTAEAGIEELCFYTDWEGMQTGSSWDIIWYRDGSPLPEYSLRDETWTNGDKGEDFWVCAGEGEKSGLPQGLYEVGFFVDGLNVFAEGFELSEEIRELHEVTWTNDVEDGADICSLAVNPKGSGPVGLNELPDGEPLGSGESVTLEVPEGTIVAAADDCDGNRLALQLDGLLVDGPKNYSIGVT